MTTPSNVSIVTPPATVQVTEKPLPKANPRAYSLLLAGIAEWLEKKEAQAREVEQSHK
jgi:hypothetical protein